jgi:3-isopropylmalate dehydrogenase
MHKRITVLPGDGIGPELTEQAIHVMDLIGHLFGHTFTYTHAWIGGAAIDRFGTPLPDETVEVCRTSDAVLLGAVGGPKWDKNPAATRPEAGLLGIRKALNVYANLRPVRVTPALVHASTLKPSVIEDVDLLIVRELTGGLYFGTPRERRQGKHGLEVVDTLYYTEREMERIIRLGFDLAKSRRGHLTSVDKANVLESSRLWREVVERVAHDYPDVTVSHMLVDNAAMQLIRNPRQFDVIVTENLFGDILSDEAAMLTGSIGMLPSASIGDGGPGLYEPIHGSAPDIAGKGIANPLATLLSVAMMFRHSLGMPREAEVLERAIDDVLNEGYRTVDIAAVNTQVDSNSQFVSNPQVVSTEEMTRLVQRSVEKRWQDERKNAV